MGESLIASGSADTVLVVGAEKLSSIVDWTDRNTCILFADGAGATVLRRSKERGSQKGVLSSFMRSDGALTELLWRPAGGGAEPFTPEVFEQKRHYVRMAGREVFKHAVVNMAAVVGEVLEKAGLESKDIDWLVPHQANKRIIDGTGRKLGLPPERVVMTVDKHANTSAASIPLALDVAVKDGRIKKGDLLLLEGIGGGLAWGASLVRW